MRESGRAERASANPVTKLSRKPLLCWFPGRLADEGRPDDRGQFDLPSVDFFEAKGIPNQRIDVVERVADVLLGEVIQGFPLRDGVSGYSVVPLAVGFVAGSHRPGEEGVNFPGRGLYVVEGGEFEAVVGEAFPRFPVTLSLNVKRVQPWDPLFFLEGR